MNEERACIELLTDLLAWIEGERAVYISSPETEAVYDSIAEEIRRRLAELGIPGA